MKIGGQIPCNVIPICETSKISCLMGRPHMKDALENHLKGRLFHLVHWLSITLSLRKTSQESIDLERKNYFDYSLDTLCTRGDFGRVTYWLQTLRNWKRWKKRKLIYKTQCKGSHISQRKWKFHIPSRRWTKKFVGGDQELRTSTLMREHPIRGEYQRDLQGESEGSPQPLPQDSFPDADQFGKKVLPGLFLGYALYVG